MNWPIRNSSANWTQWLPPGESQINGIYPGHTFDEDDCLAEKKLHARETIINQLTGRQPIFSVRYTQYWGRTIVGTGAYEDNVQASIPSYGLSLLQNWPLTNDGVIADWDTTPPQNVVNLAKLYNQQWNDEMVSITAEQVPLALQTAPIEVIMQISGSMNHGVMMYALGPNGIKDAWYRDSYPPYDKQFNSNDVILDYLLPLITPKNMFLQLEADGKTITLCSGNVTKTKTGFATDMAGLQSMFGDEAINPQPNPDWMSVPITGIFQSASGQFVYIKQ